MSGLLGFAENAAKSPVAFAIILTAYICLTLTCLALLSLPEAKEQMSWFDFLRTLASVASVAAFFFCVSSLIRFFSVAQLVKAILFAAMVVGSFILTAKIKKAEHSEPFVRVIHYLFSVLFAIVGIITVIMTLVKG